jgi:serine/threonine protein kinase
MTAERWARVKDIFADALEHTPGERQQFVIAAAGDDMELVREVLRLLVENERETGLLSSPPIALARPAPAESGPRFPESTVLARRFHVIRFIAQGGMGEVYEAQDLELGEHVALKTIRQGTAPDSDLLALLKKEVQLARRVTHPNVCRIYDIAQHEEVTLLSMELLDGQTLAEHLATRGPFTWRDVLPLIEQIGAGIQAAHDAGIIHGDLKPANVMLDGARAVVMDFGVALPAAQAARGIRRGGTPGYLAPEQADGRPTTTATDVYSFALVICEMLGAGRPPQFNPKAARMPAAWTRILQRCLDPDPERRYARAADVVNALQSSTKGRWQLAMRVAAVLVVAALTIALVKHRWTANNPALVQLFTETPGEYVWSVSPDGHSIAETLWDTGDLAIRDIASGRVKRITHRPAVPGYHVTWGAIFSPDNRHLIFSWNSSRTEADTRIIGADGKGERVLNTTGVTPLDWSPDGKRILALHEGSLVTISADDGSLSPVRGIKPGRIGRARFAPNGNGIVFDVAQQGGKESLFDIHRVSTGGVETGLIEHPANDSLIGWSPDRRKLIFSSDRSGKYSIWAVNVSDRGAEGEPQELRPGAGEIEPLGITEEGALYYRLEARSANVYTAVLDLASERTASPPKPVVTRFNGPYEYPNWSEDGTRLVFDSRVDVRNPELAIYNRQNGDTRMLPIDLSYVWRPQWYAHGRYIVALAMSKDGQTAHYRIDPQTGAAQQLISFKDFGPTFEGVWSSDGSTMYNRYSDWKRGLFRLNVNTRERQILYVPPSDVDLGLENLALSPDERTLAFHARNDREGTGTLMLVPAGGGEARALLTIHQPERFLYGSFTWTPDSKEILASRTKGEISEIWRVPVDGSPPAKIDFPAMRVQSLRLNRDGKTIAFTNVKQRAEIWAFERFLK